jgi:hypothetical protein
MSEGSLFAPDEDSCPEEFRDDPKVPTLSEGTSPFSGSGRTLFRSTFKPFNLQTFQRRFSTTRYPPFTTHGPPPELLPSRLRFAA